MNPSTQQSEVRPPEPGPAGERPRSRASRSRALPVTAIVVAVAGALTATAGVTGGLRGRSSSPTRVAPGKTVDQGLFSVQVRSAHTASAKLLFDNKPGPVLVVRMRVTNIGKDTTTMSSLGFGFASGVFLEPKNLEPNDVKNDPAKGTATSLPPRVPRDVDVFWKLTGPQPQRVTIDLRQWTYQIQFDHGGYYWYAGKDAATVAVVTLPVRQGGV
jgi:hypothetical protein